MEFGQWGGRRALLAGACLALCAAIGVATGQARAEAGERLLVLNDAWAPPYTTSDKNGFLDIVVGEAFRRAGVAFELVRLPAERGLINANEGIEDGDLARIGGLETQYPNLVRVPEKVADVEFVAFARDTSIVPEWNVLRRLNVGFIKGWKVYEQQFGDASRITTANDAEQLFRLIELGRIDVALYERWLGIALSVKMGLRNVRPLAPPLATRAMFVYLNRRHADLVAPLAQALRALKADGFYARARSESLGHYGGEPTR